MTSSRIITKFTLYALWSTFTACGATSFESGASKVEGKSEATASSEEFNLQVVRLLVATPKVQVPLGGSAEVFVSAEFNDGRIEDVSSKAFYSIENSKTARLATDREHTLLGEALGTTMLLLEYGSKTLGVPVDVIPSAVMVIGIEPKSVVLQVGQTQTFKVTGLLENRESIDLTSVASFASSDPTKAAFSNSSPGQLLAIDAQRSPDGKKAVQTPLTIAVEYGKAKATAIVEVIPLLQMTDEGDIKTRSATPDQLGETNKTLLFSFLKPDERIKSVKLEMHSVDLNLVSTTIGELRPMPLNPGWFQQSVVLSIAAKWTGTDHISEYRGQQIKIEVSQGNEPSRSLPVGLVWTSTPSGADGALSSQLPKRLFQGQEGDPSALPASSN